MDMACMYTPTPAAAEVFEGPEKKLEIFFAAPRDGVGFRRYPRTTWSDVLSDARCSILHVLGNDAFDAYILSESSLFVYPHKLILKTCGTTTLLLVLPKVLALAARAEVTLSHVHYSHYRYAFPHLQPAPHSSFAEEQAAVAKLLDGRITAFTAAVLGADDADDGAAHWYALCASAVPSASPSAAAAESDVLELAMEGLAPSVCDAFFAATHAPLEGRPLADAMAMSSGVAALVAHAAVDDWAFAPCGYSMNALSGRYYYTVHVTPEHGFSYASFETNDPTYATSNQLSAILAVFRPATCTVSLTTRAAHGSAGAAGERPPQAPAALYAATSPWCTTRLSEEVSVAVAAYTLVEEPAEAHRAAAAKEAAKAAVRAAGVALVVEDGADSSALSSADSESTAGLDDAAEGESLGGTTEDEAADSEAGKRPLLSGVGGGDEGGIAVKRVCVGA